MRVAPKNPCTWARGLSSKPVLWHMTTLAKGKAGKVPRAVIRINSNNEILAILIRQDQLRLKLEKHLFTPRPRSYFKALTPLALSEKLTQPPSHTLERNREACGPSPS